MKSLVEAGATSSQLEDLGVAAAVHGRRRRLQWIRDVIGQCCGASTREIGWHFCFGNAWGGDILSQFPAGSERSPHFFDTPGIDQLLLDYANRGMDGVEFLANLRLTRKCRSACSTSER
jgi:hypothetical protein